MTIKNSTRYSIENGSLLIFMASYSWYPWPLIIISVKVLALIMVIIQCIIFCREVGGRD